MLLKIVLICDEVEDFIREITIDEDATFLALNKAILDSCGYKDDQLTSFITCDDDWKEEQQITREDMGTTSEDEDVYIMEKSTLRDFISDEGQKLIFVFDPFNNRVFYMKVTEFVSRKAQATATCTNSVGEAPQQIKEIDTSYSKNTSSDKDLLLDDDNNYFGSDDFEQDDFDPEGFEIEEH